MRSALDTRSLPAVRAYSDLSLYSVPADEVFSSPAVANHPMVMQYTLYTILLTLVRSESMNATSNTTDILALNIVDLQPGRNFCDSATVPCQVTHRSPWCGEPVLGQLVNIQAAHAGRLSDAPRLPAIAPRRRGC